MSNIVTDAKDLTDDVAQKRHQDLDGKFPQLDQAQFASEDEYRQALINQYSQMRQEQYKNTCLSAGINAYDTALQCGGNMNTVLWDCGKFKNYDTIINDSIYSYAPNVLPPSTQNFSRHKAQKDNGTFKYGEYCCAASACTVEAGICDKMELSGLIKQDARNTGAANLAPFDKDHKLSGLGGKALWRQIEEGKVGPGDQISRESTGNSVSGRHAEVIVAVNRDENGKLLSYVVQGNNSANLHVINTPSSYPVKTVKDKSGKKRVEPAMYTIGCMNKWVNEQLTQEAQNLQSKTTEELQSTVAEQKEKTHQSITELEKNEQHMFATQGTNKKVQQYANWYVRNADIPDATGAVMKADQINAATMSEQKVEETRQAVQQNETQITEPQVQTTSNTQDQPTAQHTDESNKTNSNTFAMNIALAQQQQGRT